MPPICQQLAGLSGPFTKIARAMSKQWGVVIVPSGSKCSTDGHNVIHIPFTADLLPLGMRQILHGSLDHEVCHVAEEKRHADAGMPSPIKVFRAERNKKIAVLFNVFEDVRIELFYGAQYKGMGENLNAQNRHHAALWAKSYEDRTDNNWWHAFGCAIILTARGQKCDWAHEGEIGEYLEICAEEIEAVQLPSCEWATDAMDLAKAVYEKVKDRHEEQKKKDRSRKKRSRRGGDGEGGGGEGGGEGGGDDEGGDEGDAFTPDDEATMTDLAELTREDMSKAVIDDAKMFDRYIPHPKSIALDKVEVAYDDGAAFYFGAKADVQAQISTLRGRQRALLMSWKRRRVVTGLDAGFIDDDALPFVRTGERNVFANFTDKRDLDTAILQLVDCSGSMGNNEEYELEDSGTMVRNSAYFASRASIALTESWSGLNIPNEVLGYTVNDYAHTGITIEDLEGPFFCRAPMRNLIFKGFDEKLKKCRGRFASMRGHLTNIDGESLAWAARRLAVRRERRKILVVVADGMPSTTNGRFGMANSYMLETNLRDTIKAVTASGIEVICIGAGTRTPGKFYNESTGAKFVPILKIDTMAIDIFRVMKAKITRGMAA